METIDSQCILCNNKFVHSNSASKYMITKYTKINLEDINVKVAIAYLLAVIAFLLLYLAFTR
jgi:hypothetical protein